MQNWSNTSYFLPKHFLSCFRKDYALSRVGQGWGLTACCVPLISWEGGREGGGGSQSHNLEIRLDCCPIVCLSRPKLSAIKAKCCAQINYFQQEILLAGVGLGWSALSNNKYFCFHALGGWW